MIVDLLQQLFKKCNCEDETVVVREHIKCADAYSFFPSYIYHNDSGMGQFCIESIRQRYTSYVILNISDNIFIRRDDSEISQAKYPAIFVCSTIVHHSANRNPTGLRP